MGKKKQEQATGTAGAGTSWSHPLATETEDGARIVYVAVPNEDTLALTQEYHEARLEREPRINALTTVIGLRGFSSDKGNIDKVLADAAKVEAFIRTGAVPATEPGTEEGPAAAKSGASHFHGDEECFENHGLGTEDENA